MDRVKMAALNALILSTGSEPTLSKMRGTAPMHLQQVSRMDSGFMAKVGKLTPMKEPVEITFLHIYPTILLMLDFFSSLMKTTPPFLGSLLQSVSTMQDGLLLQLSRLLLPISTTEDRIGTNPSSQLRDRRGAKQLSFFGAGTVISHTLSSNSCESWNIEISERREFTSSSCLISYALFLETLTSTVPPESFLKLTSCRGNYLVLPPSLVMSSFLSLRSTLTARFSQEPMQRLLTRHYDTLEQLLTASIVLLISVFEIFIHQSIKDHSCFIARKLVKTLSQLIFLTMDIQYSFSQTFGRGHSLLHQTSPSAAARSPDSSGSPQPPSREFNNQPNLNRGPQRRKISNIDDISDRMERLLQELRTQNNTKPIDRRQSRDQANLGPRSNSHVLIRNHNQKNDSIKIGGSASSHADITLDDRKPLKQLEANKPRRNCASSTKLSVRKHEETIPRRSYQVELARDPKQMQDYKVMRGKVKTIESENGDFLEQCGSEKESDYLNSNKSSNASSVYKRFTCFNSTKKNADLCAQRQQSTETSAPENTFEDKLKQINKKIDDYQRKASSYTRHGVPKEEKQNHQASFFAGGLSQNAGTSSYKLSRQNSSYNKSGQNSTEVSRILNKYKISEEYMAREQAPSDREGKGGNESGRTPNWRIKNWDESEENSFDSGQYRHNFLNSDFRRKDTKETRFVKKEIDFNEQFEQIKRQRQVLGHSFEKPTPSLKDRMSAKLNLQEGQKIISKQVNLDEEFRKSKKQFSKVPDIIGKVDKWKLLKSKLQRQGLNIDQTEMQETFALADDEADPFYSIQIQDVLELEQIINRAVQNYLQAEAYFATSLLNSLSRSDADCLIPEGPQQIKLDEFTIIVSNFTRSSLMCRDTALIFKRLCRVLNCSEMTRDGLRQCLVRAP